MDEFADEDNFRILEEDALQLDFSRFKTGENKLKLVANLPYYISTAILQHLLEQRETFGEFILMLQKEVVDRITSQPGNKERGFLTVLVEAFCDAEKLFDVPPMAFRPIPKVWSSVVKLDVKEQTQIEDPGFFRQLLSIGFSQKRKTILNNLKTGFSNPLRILEKSGIDPQRRAETLMLEEWIVLMKNCEED